jgi:hypothetical protein
MGPGIGQGRPAGRGSTTTTAPSLGDHQAATDSADITFSRVSVALRWAARRGAGEYAT